MATPYFDPAQFDTLPPTPPGLRAYSAQDFVTKALRLLNVIDAVTPAAPEQMDQGFDSLLEMIDDWRTHAALIWTYTPYRYALVAGQQAYTIGPGGDFDQVRPQLIPRWTLILDRNASPLIRIPHSRTLTPREWHAVRMQQTPGSVVTALYYDKTFNALGQGTVWVYPVPSGSPPAHGNPGACPLDIELWLPQPLEGFVDLTTPYIFPPGYTRAIRYNLAVELATDYPGAMTDAVQLIARQAIGDIKRANFQPRYAEFDPMLIGWTRGRRYNPYSDT